MAVITPQTDVYLLKVPLEIDSMNQLTFANATAQFNYFNSLPKQALEPEDFTYQRKDGVIRYGVNYDALIGYNYVMYRNEAYSNKWFYAYISKMEYVNDNVTFLYISTDYWQTWQFDLTFKPVLIDREHTNNDTVGANTLPEELELGEMVVNGTVTNFGGVGGTGMSNYCVVVEVSQVENTGESATLSYSWASGSHDSTPRLNSIDRGTIPLVLGVVSGAGNTPQYVTRLYDKAGLGEAIVNVYMIPTSLVGQWNQINITYTPNEGSSETISCGVPDSKTGTYDLGASTFTKPTTINGYTPKNKKLLCYPFCYFNISNNAGTSMPYRYEDFSSSVSFAVEGTFGLSGSTKAIPQNYLNISSTENGMDYSVTGPKYPVCSWKSDSYTNWLTQNAVNLNTAWTRELLGAGVDIVGGTIRGGMGGAAAGGIGAVPGAAIGAAVGTISAGASLINLAREQHLAKTQANMVSDQVKGNTGAGDFLWGKYRSPFTYLPMSIKAEYARCADEFLSQFGYKCNRVKVPNITGRRNWNYVKTVGCYIEADIPQDDLQNIKNMFDRGITLWHNPSTFADYSQNNDII